ncbi:hypothetical protein H4J46_02600 [Colwellia sp. MB02u-6]|jgi:hypothetical protein|uniref:hypothetical protein n=1 Tax=Colwellia sp. MB02u-6 TaxID=2759824 RepID=UPI0015F77541|nr:hypothetical protein [Colwellia sp. MB02u-6]MBA6326843.1 hypothetical protein [Colwellia sp. MB02u-6]
MAEMLMPKRYFINTLLPISFLITPKVEILVAGAEDPDRRSLVATGITPHEHNGNGAPINAALIMALLP